MVKSNNLNRGHHPGGAFCLQLQQFLPNCKLSIMCRAQDALKPQVSSSTPAFSQFS